MMMLTCLRNFLMTELLFDIVRYGTVSGNTRGKADNIKNYVVRYGTVSGNTRGKADNIIPLCCAVWYCEWKHSWESG
jgi:hypothetical protein